MKNVQLFVSYNFILSCWLFKEAENYDNGVENSRIKDGKVSSPMRENLGCVRFFPRHKPYHIRVFGHASKPCVHHSSMRTFKVPYWTANLFSQSQLWFRNDFVACKWGIKGNWDLLIISTAVRLLTISKNMSCINYINNTRYFNNTLLQFSTNCKKRPNWRQTMYKKSFFSREFRFRPSAFTFDCTLLRLL